MPSTFAEEIFYVWIHLSVKINNEYCDFKELPPALLAQQGPIGPAQPKEQRKAITAGHRLLVLLKQYTQSATVHINFLQLTSAEWTQVGQFTDLLSYADVAQQAFSSDRGSTLHLAIPATGDTSQIMVFASRKAQVYSVASPLKAAAKKLDEYYKKTTDTAAYVIAMLLDPTSKLAYFKKHWPSNLLNDVLASSNYKSKVGSLKRLIQEVQSDSEDDSEAEPGAASIGDPSKPWRAEFTSYI
ncbi:hypothetical protein BDR03DRAFT_1019571 [Suillus americanus]|nr:hypothetical protein BDR03DRAFT_1019571 [Suillus americanus]